MHIFESSDTVGLNRALREQTRIVPRASQLANVKAPPDKLLRKNHVARRATYDSR